MNYILDLPSILNFYTVGRVKLNRNKIQLQLLAIE